MRRWILIGLLGLGALASCSVKEDRSDCGLLDYRNGRNIHFHEYLVRQSKNP